MKKYTVNEYQKMNIYFR